MRFAKRGSTDVALRSLTPGADTIRHLVHAGDIPCIQYRQFLLFLGRDGPFQRHAAVVHADMDLVGMHERVHLQDHAYRVGLPAVGPAFGWTTLRWFSTNSQPPVHHARTSA